MATFTAAFSPATVQVGTTSTVSLCVTPKDATGAVLAGNYVDQTGSPPTFSGGMVDITGQTIIGSTPQGAENFPTPTSCGAVIYSGIAAGPATAQLIEGNTTASATLQYLPASAFVPNFGVSGGPGIAEYALGQTNPQNTITGFGGNAAYDKNGNVWVLDATGFRAFSPTASVAASIPTDALTAGLIMQTIDANGLIYTIDSATASNLVVVSPNIGSGTAQVVREIATSGLLGFGTRGDVAVDHAGTIYALLAGGEVVAFAAGTTNGNVAPIATDSSNQYIEIAADSQGDVFATVPNSLTIFKWPAGTLGVSAPVTLPLTIPSGANSSFIQSFAVFGDGSGCAELLSAGRVANFQGNATWVGSNGTTPICPTVPSSGFGTYFGPTP